MKVKKLSDLKLTDDNFSSFSKSLLDRDPNNKWPMSENNIMFLDIETIRSHKKYEDMKIKEQELWVKKAERYMKYENEVDYTSETPEDLFYEKGGLFPEYAKIAVITVGIVKSDGFKKYSFHGEEEQLLRNFCRFVSVIEKKNEKSSKDNKIEYIFGGSIKWFDLPFIFRRLLKYKIYPPELVFGTVFEKPWEKRIIDIQDIWRFGTKLGDATMDTICFMLGVESPKKDMDGSIVSKEYYDNNNIDGIIEYCEADVQSLYDIFVALTKLEKVTYNG